MAGIQAHVYTMPIPYVWLPNIETPIQGNVSGWTEIGFNTATRNMWLCAINNHKVKAAYWMGSGGNYYYIAAMCDSIFQGTFFDNIIATQSYDPPNYYLYPLNYYKFYSEQIGGHAYAIADIGQAIPSKLNPDIPIYQTKSEALAVMNDGVWDIPADTIPITYITVNAIASGPSEESAGNDVSVTIMPDSGYVIRNPSQGDSISVYNKNGYIPFNYADGVLTFTVPDE